MLISDSLRVRELSPGLSELSGERESSVIEWL